MTTKRLIALMFAICCLGVPAFSQTTEQPTPTPTPKPQTEHFTAVAMLSRAPATTATWIDIRIFRYSSNARTQQMAGALVDGGQDALVKALEKAKVKIEKGKLDIEYLGMEPIRLANLRKY